MVEIKKLNETAVGIFTKSEKETDKIIKELKACEERKVYVRERVKAEEMSWLVDEFSDILYERYGELYLPYKPVMEVLAEYMRKNYEEKGE